MWQLVLATTKQKHKGEASSGSCRKTWKAPFFIGRFFSPKRPGKSIGPEGGVKMSVVFLSQRWPFNQSMVGWLVKKNIPVLTIPRCSMGLEYLPTSTISLSQNVLVGICQNCRHVFFLEIWKTSKFPNRGLRIATTTWWVWAKCFFLLGNPTKITTNIPQNWKKIIPQKNNAGFVRWMWKWKWWEVLCFFLNEFLCKGS